MKELNWVALLEPVQARKHFYTKYGKAGTGFLSVGMGEIGDNMCLDKWSVFYSHAEIS